jgi:hypothetical protein
MILLVLFIAMFSFDVFEEAHSPGQIALGLFMHNLPDLLMLFALIITWRRPLWAACAMLVFAGFATVFFQAWRMSSTLIIVTVCPMIIAGLFYIAHSITKNQE